MARKKPDWLKVRTEYETTKTSYRKLAEKYGIPFPTIRDRAKREGWAAASAKTKEEIIKRVVTKTSQKLADRQAGRIVDELDPALEATNLINKLILETLQDEQQFKRHIITKKESRSIAGVGSESRQWVETMETDVVDTKRLESAVKALKTSKELQRLLEGVISAGESEKLAIEKERLKLEKAKAAQKNETGDKEIIVTWDESVEGLAD